MRTFLKWLRRIILVALASGLLFIGGKIYTQLDDAAEQRHSTYQYQPAANPRLPVVARGQPQPQPYQPYCNDPQGNEQADLCAQWAAVEQVSEANRIASTNVRLSLWIMILSFFGTAGLIWTLYETWRTNRRELRAYVFVDSMAVHGRRTKRWALQFRGIPMSQVVIKNAGATPAFKVVHWGEAEFRPVAEEELLTIPKLQRLAHTNAVPPGGLAQKTRDVRKLSRSEIAAFRRGELVLYVWGRIEYTDAFGADHFTTYRFSYTGRWPIPEMGILNFCANGNNAN